MFKHILVPTDGSSLSRDTVVRVASFARETGAQVTLFYARPEATGAYEGIGALSSPQLAAKIHARLEAAAKEILDDAEQTLLEAGVSCKRLMRVGNKPYDLIIKAAEANACDLIFMASHGRRGIGALLLGSETQKVLTHSRIPVLIYR